MGRNRNRNRNRNRKKKDSAGSSSAGQTTSPAASTTNNTTAGVNDDAAPTSTGTAHANFDRSDNDQDGCLNSEQGTRDPTSCEEATSTESGRLSELTNRLQLSLTQRLVLGVLLQRFLADDLRCTMARIMLLSLTCTNAQKSRLMRDTADEYGIRMMKMIALAHYWDRD